MRVNKPIFWCWTAIILISASLFKNNQINVAAAEYIQGIAQNRAALDPLLQNEKRPRLLIAGGSSAAGGYDSQEIASLTGVPTFNISLLNDGFDYRNLFAIIEYRSKARDTVVLSATRLVIHKKENIDTLQKKIYGEYWLLPDSKIRIGWRDYFVSLPLAPIFSGPTLLRLIFNLIKPASIDTTTQQNFDPANSSVSLLPSNKILPYLQFNVYGDWVNCITTNYPTPTRFDPMLVNRSQTYLTALNNLAKALKKKGTRLRVTTPTILIETGASKQWINQRQQIEQSLPQVDFLPLDAERQLLTDGSRFCDSSTHLLRSEIHENNEAMVSAMKNIKAMENK